jgi:mono/diheme cytochrome c family protein
MNMKTIAVGLIIGVSSVVLHAGDIKVDVSKLPPAAAKQGVTFDVDIKPIFEKACFKCHGPDVEKPKGKMRADTRASVLKGGENAPDVTPGDLSKSPLIAQVAQTTADEDDYMPPKGNKAKIPPLTKEQVGLVRAWIEQGAK